MKNIHVSFNNEIIPYLRHSSLSFWFVAVSVSPEIISKWKESKLEYDRLLAVKTTLEDDFFQCLLETEDNDFIVHNLKDAIGQKPYLQKWWTLLITYLKDRNPTVSLLAFCKAMNLFCFRQCWKCIRTMSSVVLSPSRTWVLESGLGLCPTVYRWQRNARKISAGNRSLRIPGNWRVVEDPVSIWKTKKSSSKGSWKPTQENRCEAALFEAISSESPSSELPLQGFPDGLHFRSCQANHPSETLSNMQTFLRRFTYSCLSSAGSGILPRGWLLRSQNWVHRLRSTSPSHFEGVPSKGLILQAAPHQLPPSSLFAGPVPAFQIHPADYSVPHPILGRSWTVIYFQWILFPCKFRKC